ncbi:hypothetical protein TNIN_416121 [Trichonephila inaurata madagascariensis]|uniref:Uncharacterized protein n=1 Tax=Trichonephila inaurata madagascariensis TaxID=2747483 RepID=A0A8X6JHV1_9ARAC|nr:hypothetical protein TNIN_158001 [Trichonephila inaurata madagascariensis]GFY54985.1 hypothetical protein TNIN_416121 [Trichonephila inaurata madagascariensis]
MVNQGYNSTIILDPLPILANDDPKDTLKGGLFACRRGVYHVAREEARHREEAGHYMPGDFAEAEDRATEPADSDPCYLRKCFMKTHGAYDLGEAELTAIRQVREVDPEWNPQEPRPLVVFSEWQLPYDTFGYSPDYYYQFRFRMTTRDDLYLDAVPMVWGPEKGKFLVMKARPKNRF